MDKEYFLNMERNELEARINEVINRTYNGEIKWKLDTDNENSFIARKGFGDKGLAKLKLRRIPNRIQSSEPHYDFFINSYGISSEHFSPIRYFGQYLFNIIEN